MSSPSIQQPSGITARALPQHFSFIASPAQADRALEIIDLKQADFGVRSSSELDLQKAIIRELVVAKVNEIVNPATLEDIRILRLEESDLARIKLSHESGFRIVDAGAIRRGEGPNAELVTVIFAKAAKQDTLIVPLVFAHTTKSEAGWKIKAAIDEWCKEVHGDSADGLIAGWGTRLFRGLGNLLDSPEEAVKAAEREARIREEKKRSDKDWIDKRMDRVNFVIQTANAIRNANTPESKGLLLSQIQLQHYDSLVDEIIEGQNKVVAAQTLASLISLELSVKRSEKLLSYTDGPKNGSQVWYRMTGNMRIEMPTEYIKKILVKELQSPIPEILVRTLDELARGLRDPPSAWQCFWGDFLRT